MAGGGLRQRKFFGEFLRWWISLSLIAGIPMGLVGFAFGTYRSPQSISDFLEVAKTILVSAVISSPFAAAVAAIIGWLAVSIFRRFGPQSEEPLCPKCAYNLRGSVNGICSECGTLIVEAIQSQVQGGAAPRSASLLKARMIFWTSVVGLGLVLWGLFVYLVGVFG